MLVECGREGRASAGAFGFVNMKGLSGHIVGLVHLGGGFLAGVAPSPEIGFDFPHGVLRVLRIRTYLFRPQELAIGNVLYLFARVVRGVVEVGVSVCGFLVQGCFDSLGG